MAETPVVSTLLMDRSDTLGNSQDVFSRRSLHVKIGNQDTEAIPVYVTDSPPTTPNTVITIFNAITNVSTNNLTTLVTYTVPALKTFNLQKIIVSGSNIAQYDFFVDSNQIARQRTYFSGGLNAEFNLNADPDRGLPLNSSQIVSVKVIHQRPDLGDFEATISGILVG